MQQRFPPPIAPQLVQVQGVGLHIDCAGTQEQAQLEQRMVHHVPHRARRGQRPVVAQQHGAGEAHGDVADLGHGGAGQRAFQIHGEHAQHRAQGHSK